LFTGDIQESTEARLVSKNATALDADVLKAGHHGSNTSSNSPFLDAVTPEVVIISLGAGYGYPDFEALEKISLARNEHLFRTDLDGTITVTVNGCSKYYSIVTENNEKTVVDIPRSEMVIC
jgi:competence protein ComEC